MPVKAVESTPGGPRRSGLGARVAQLAEQGTLNPKVLGSIPGAGTSQVDLALREYDFRPPRHTPGDLQACSIGLSIV